LADRAASSSRGTAHDFRNELSRSTSVRRADSYTAFRVGGQPSLEPPKRVRASIRAGSEQWLGIVTIKPEAVLFGDYRILGELRQGGMGAVYRALHLGLDVERAIKVIRADQSDDPIAAEFFLREAHALLDVQHEAVVRCHDLLRD
jgi:serine/threonine protein kinase